SISRLLNAGASFDSLQRVYLDPAEERHVDGFPIDSLSGPFAPYKPVVEATDSGKVSKVFELPSPLGQGRSKWAIIRIVKKLPPGPPTYDLLKDAIRKRLSEDMGREAYIKDLRKKTYIDIRYP